jgi:D-xylulose reductase
LAATLGPITPVNVSQQSVDEVVDSLTGGWGADVLFECSGSARAASEIFRPLRPGGTVVYVGMPVEPVPIDVVGAQVKEARVETVFRYAHVYDRAVALMGSGRIDVKPLITETFPFARSVDAFDFARKSPPGSVKVQIELPQ